MEVPEASGHWYLKLLKRAQVPKEVHEDSLQALKSCNIDSYKALVKAYGSRTHQGVDFGLADLKIPMGNRARLVEILQCPSVPTTLEETRVCAELSRLVHNTEGDIMKEGQLFQKQRKPNLFLHAKCPKSNQKYLLCVLRLSKRPCLFVAFAGAGDTGDWTKNLTTCTVSDWGVGGRVHGGFVERSLCLKFHFVHRMAEQLGCEAVIFTGHCLGGAVSHLSCLWALRQGEFKRLNIPICSVAFAAPLVVCEEVVKEVDQRGWSHQFLNIVNEDDPVPQLLTLTASLGEVYKALASLPNHKDIGASLNEALGCLSDSKTMSALLLECTMSPHMSDALQKLAALPLEEYVVNMFDIYNPLGTCVFIETSDGKQYKCSWSQGTDVMEQLGPASFMEHRIRVGSVTSDNLQKHKVCAYKSVLQHPAVTKFLDVPLDIYPVDVRSFLPGKAPASSSSSQITIPVCIETVKVWLNNDEDSVVYGIGGRHLDLLGAAGVEVWSGSCFEVARELAISSPGDTSLQLKQAGHQQAQKLMESKRLRFRPDAGECIVFDMVEADFLHFNEMPTLTRDEELQVNRHFLRRALKQAWLMKHYADDDRLLDLVRKLDKLDEGHFHLAKHVRNASTDPAEALCRIGEGDEGEQVIAEFQGWICPPDGLQLLSKSKLVTRGVVTVASLTGVTACLLMSGGLSLLIPALPHTGGFGTASGFVGLGGFLRWFFSNDRLPQLYDKMLTVYLEESGGSILQRALTFNEFKKEEHLIQCVEARKQNGNPVWIERGRFTDLLQSGLDEVNKRYEAIKLVHEIKKVALIPIVFVSGPANSGKTTLVSQLLMCPELEQQAGFQQKERTTKVQAHKWGNGALVIDTPGLDAAQSSLVRKFEAGACAARAYVYIRSYQGLEQQDDLKNIVVTMDQSSSSSPHVLILLNHVIEKRRLATGDVLSRDQLLTIKDQMLTNLKTEYQHAHTLLWAETALANLPGLFHSKFANVEICFADLSRTHEEIDTVASDIKDLVLDAQGVAAWCERVLDPKGESSNLHSAVQTVNWSQWVEKCKAARRRRLQEEERQLQLIMQTRHF